MRLANPDESALALEDGSPAEFGAPAPNVTVALPSAPSAAVVGEAAPRVTVALPSAPSEVEFGACAPSLTVPLDVPALAPAVTSFEFPPEPSTVTRGSAAKATLAPASSSSIPAASPQASLISGLMEWFSLPHRT
jgi:hypothetical protein